MTSWFVYHVALSDRNAKLFNCKLFNGALKLPGFLHRYWV